MHMESTQWKKFILWTNLEWHNIPTKDWNKDHIKYGGNSKQIKQRFKFVVNINPVILAWYPLYFVVRD